MTVRIYRSTDTSAPVLTGEAGSLINVLDKCLVAGYGSKTAAGWSKPFTGTNLAAFKSASAPFAFLRVNDAGPGVGTYKEARVVGYEDMSDVNTGTNPFPTAAQLTNGYFIRKSATADATARGWILAATDKLFYLFIANGDTASKSVMFHFGDIKSYKTNDNYRAAICGRVVENSATYSITNDPSHVLTGLMSSAAADLHIARFHTEEVGAVVLRKTSDTAKVGVSGAYIIGSTGLPYPNPADGGLYLGRIIVGSYDPFIRGELPGIWCPLHNQPVSNGDTFSSVVGLTGRAFQAISIYSSGQVFLETSDTWDTN